MSGTLTKPQPTELQKSRLTPQQIKLWRRARRLVNMPRHPVIADALRVLRDRDTQPAKFRQYMRTLNDFLFFDATRNLPLMNVQVETPLDVADAKKLISDCVDLVTIPRAGDLLLNLDYLPKSRVFKILVQRDEKDASPQLIHTKLPDDLEGRVQLVFDVMLATGGSAITAISELKKRHAGKIIFSCVIAAPEGVLALKKAHPDVTINTLALDDRLNNKAYIVPGLGDAGDRLFGTS